MLKAVRFIRLLQEHAGIARGLGRAEFGHLHFVVTNSYFPIGSKYLLRIVLEAKVLPDTCLLGLKNILRMVLDPLGFF